MEHKIYKKPEKGKVILADGEYYNFNDSRSGLNDNVLIVGGSGTGKTRGVVRPNILQAEGSYIVSDPKGNLYDLYREYLKGKGYRVERLDFARPERSTVQYNFFRYIHNQTDILRVAHLLRCASGGSTADQFWEQSSELIIECVVSFLMEFRPEGSRNLGTLLDMLREGHRMLDNAADSQLDHLMLQAEKYAQDSFAVRCYQSVSVNPTRTWNCVISSALAKYAAYDTAEIRSLLEEDTLNISSIGSRKTALFVVVSDTDRSMDDIANIFFTQAMQELCRMADQRPENCLKVPVRFILDDFATNVHIDEFPRMISSIRSRGLSTMIMIQAEAQLKSVYQQDAETIIGNCDSYVYLGGNDVHTAWAVGERCDQPMREILNMPIGTCWVFRRGQKAREAMVFDLDAFERACIERKKTERSKKKLA